jgi:hypothetical protein
MISRRDLELAVTELENSPPTYQVCSKLADLYIILDHLKDEYAESMGDTEFLRVIRNKDINGIMGVMDELMSATKVLSPKLYENVIIRINEL